MASTQVDLHTSQSFPFNRSKAGHSTQLPEYYDDEGIQLSVLSQSTTRSDSSLPRYEDAVVQASSSSSSSAPPALLPTHSYHIEARGHPAIALPLPPKPDPIEIYPMGQTCYAPGAAYRSLRPERRSGSCALVRADDPKQTPLCTTTYRWGCHRTPRIQLLQTSASQEEFEVVSKSFATRSQVIRTHLGTFEWRYASRNERREADADSLIVFDRVTTVALAGGKKEEHRRQVARLVRNAEFRSEGSRRSTAGNGGRLEMDLREWIDGKSEAGQMELLIISSCLVMLKKEVDRRRMLQASVMAGAASGGP